MNTRCWSEEATSCPRSLSDLFLESSHGVSLHHGLRRLRLHYHDLAEHLALARLGRRLHAGLHHAQAWDGELPGLLHLRGAHTREAVQDLGDLRLLLLALVGDGLRERALGHGSAGLHRLHRSHCVEKEGGWTSPLRR